MIEGYSLHDHTIMRKFTMDAGHKIYNHEGKCNNLHGHRFDFDVYFKSPELNKLGMVEDFAKLKGYIQNWIDYHWDHGMILSKDDSLSEWFQTIHVMAFKADGERANIISPLYGQKCYILPFNPTAENLGSYLLKKTNDILQTENFEVKAVQVDCWETPNCMASAKI